MVVHSKRHHSCFTHDGFGGHPSGVVFKFLFIFVWVIQGGVNCEWSFNELVQTFCEWFMRG